MKQVLFSLCGHNFVKILWPVVLGEEIVSLKIQFGIRRYLY
jgi:hypothetical protein